MENETILTEPLSISGQERFWAAFSHLSSLGMGMGLIVPLIGWDDSQHKKSNYQSFQALQAYGYQSIGYTVWMLGYLLMVMLAVLVFFVVAMLGGDTAGGNEIIPAVFSFVLLFLIGIGFLVYLGLPVIAAIACALGKDFRYPFLGGRLARYLGYAPGVEMDKEKQLRWVAAMGHFAVIIPTWGLLGPVYAWLSSGKRSAYLKFQSAQTTIYQVLVNVLYFALSFAWVAIALVISVLFSAANSDFGMPAMVVTMGMLCLAGGMLLILPALHILGQWAGLRTLQGHNYRYPLLGALLEKRIPSTDGVTTEEELA